MGHPSNTDGLKPIRLAVPGELRAGSLVLRSWDTDDVDDFERAILESLDHLRPFMPWVALEPVSFDDRVIRIERWAREAKQGTDWTVGVFVDGAVAGSAGLHQRREPGLLEIGYWVHRSFTGRGVATLASYLLTEFAFQNERTDAVEIWHDRANHRSGGVPRRLGFELIEERPADPDARAPGDEGIDCRWRITRAKWPLRRPPIDDVLLRS
ncbi:MAG: GNAT family N-acetyltransferase [Acidimicrobiales bacterium]